MKKFKNYWTAPDGIKYEVGPGFSMLLMLKVANGCGPDTWKRRLIPDKIKGRNFSYACGIHDVDYFLGTTKREKREADGRFRRNMKTKAKTFNMDWKVNMAIWVYYWLVVRFGDRYFFKVKEVS